MCLFFFFYLYGDHRDLHGLTHSSPTRRSSDLVLMRDPATRDPWSRKAAAVPATPCSGPAEAVGDADLVFSTVTSERALEAATEAAPHRSEEHTSELQSLMRISYAVFCLKKQKDETT